MPAHKETTGIRLSKTIEYAKTKPPMMPTFFKISIWLYKFKSGGVNAKNKGRSEAKLNSRSKCNRG